MQIGMRAVIRDVQDYVDDNAPLGEDIDSPRLRAYLLACLITAGGYDDPGDEWGYGLGEG